MAQERDSKEGFGTDYWPHDEIGQTERETAAGDEKKEGSKLGEASEQVGKETLADVLIISNNLAATPY